MITLKQARKNAGHTQIQCAVEMGVSQTIVVNQEKGISPITKIYQDAIDNYIRKHNKKAGVK